MIDSAPVTDAGTDPASDPTAVPAIDPAPTDPAFLTIGHSNRSLEEFLDLLTDSGAEVVIDVRKLPGSRANPQFNADVLAEALAERGIELRRLEGLTGRRTVSRDVPFDVNAWWENRSFHNYADHALSEEFALDIDVLLSWSDAQRCAVMCSEAVWWRCHRRIIADYLLARDRPVRHVLGKGQTAEAVLSSGAVVDADAEPVRITYPKR